MSMLECYDLYRIRAKLAKVKNEYEDPFGGINFIFTGDFAQLPPVNGVPLYSVTVNTNTNSQSLCAQENCIGKALWH